MSDKIYYVNFIRRQVHFHSALESISKDSNGFSRYNFNNREIWDEKSDRLHFAARFD